MALGSVKASTQDGTSGTPVATGVNEDDVTKALQASVTVGNKSTYAEASRTGLTALDAPTGGDMTTTGFAGTAGANLTTCGNALSLSCRATCSVASATLTGRVAFYNAAFACIALSEVITFTSDPTRRLGNAAGDFLAQRVVVDAGQAQMFRFFVESVTAGTWAVYGRPI